MAGPVDRDALLRTRVIVGAGTAAGFVVMTAAMGPLFGGEVTSGAEPLDLVDPAPTGGSFSTTPAPRVVIVEVRRSAPDAGTIAADPTITTPAAAGGTSSPAETLPSTDPVPPQVSQPPAPAPPEQAAPPPRTEAPPPPPPPANPPQSNGS